MNAPPTVYEVKVAGHLDDHWSDWLGGFTITRHPEGTSTLTGTATDQAQLHGVLAGLRDVGVELVALHTVEPVEPAEPAPPSLGRPLRTRRLTLRAAIPEDAEATWAYRQLADVNEWLSGTPDTYDGYLTQFADSDRLAATVIVERHDGTVIGDFMLRRQDAWAQTDVATKAADQEVELGWVLDPAHTGLGYATEAVAGLLRHSFEELRVHRVIASCFAANVASWRLMERLGMRREAHTRRDALHRSGQWLDSFSYALLADEWPPASQPARHTHQEKS
jgi:RimJ/RimL family protein N-acetyltransferase